MELMALLLLGAGILTTVGRDDGGDPRGSQNKGPPPTTEGTLAITSVELAGNVTYSVTLDGVVLVDLPMGTTGNVLTTAQITEVDLASTPAG